MVYIGKPHFFFKGRSIKMGGGQAIKENRTLKQTKKFVEKNFYWTLTCVKDIWISNGVVKNFLN